MNLYLEGPQEKPLPFFNSINMQMTILMLSKTLCANIDWREFLSSLAYSFIRRALILGVCLGAVYYFTMFYNTQDAMGGQKFKFEVKTAKDIN